MVKEADFIIIDEDSCMTWKLFECLNRFLKELMECDEDIGGKLVLMMGDFRQALPVIQAGRRPDVISACIKTSHLWPRVITFQLKRNMRVKKLIHPDSSPERIQQLTVP